MWIENRYEDQLVNIDNLVQITVEEMSIDKYAVVGYDTGHAHNPIIIESYGSEEMARAAILHIKEAIKRGNSVLFMPNLNAMKEQERRSSYDLFK